MGYGRGVVKQFDAWAQDLGVLGLVVFGLAAMIEYVVPPFPGDTITLLGGVYAVRGERSWWAVLLAVTLGSVLGMAADYWVGRAIAHRVDAREKATWMFIKIERIHSLQQRMRKRGAWLLIGNRFFPAFRATIFVAAGAARMPLSRVLGFGSISALAWNGGLLALGLLLGGNIERLEAWLRNYQTVALIALGVVLVAVAGRVIYKRSRTSGHETPSA
jgi:membrane protein DedA with SNARE-associated domain